MNHPYLINSDLIKSLPTSTMICDKVIDDLPQPNLSFQLKSNSPMTLSDNTIKISKFNFFINLQHTIVKNN